jgi:MFS family permease
MTEPRTERARLRRAASAALAGTAIEYYDFVIYGTAATLVFGRLFFPSASGSASMLAALATYAVAFFARPLGGVVFGRLGDRLGRRSNLIVTVSLMGTATVLIGCLPTYREIGPAAPVLLVALRFAQGLALGGEWGGAVLMAVEHAPRERAGFFGTFAQLGSPIGALLASGVFWVVAGTVPDLAGSGVWRIPFLIAAVPTCLALLARLRVTEPPEFERAKQQAGGRAAAMSSPLRELARNHRGRLALTAGALLLGFGGFQIVTVYMLLVFAPSVGVPASTSLAAGVVLNCASVLTFPLYGKLGDRFGTARLSVLGCAYTAVLALPMFAMVASGSPLLVVVAVPICYAGSNLVFALNSGLVARLFPVSVRSTAISLASTCAALVGGALAPIVCTALRRAAGGAYWPVAGFLILQALVSLGCIAAIDRSDRRSGPRNRRTRRSRKEDPNAPRKPRLRGFAAQG